MRIKPLLTGAIFLLVVLLIGVSALLTEEEADPCANPQADISAAILADSEHDRDALANRAILMRGQCEPRQEAGPDEVKVDADPEAESPSAPETARPTVPVTVPTETPAEILQHRCMVCHGCYDAPCQLKLEAHAGLERGASKDLVYDGARLRAANLTRLFDDADSADDWRKKGFYPVLDDEQPKNGVMYRMLQLKQAHPLPTEGPLPKGFDFSLYRDQQCPKQDEFDRFSRENPLWGMPYGLPALNAEQHLTLTNWLEKGAPAPALDPLPKASQELLARWENFLNGDTPREQLMARYIYEHLFLASLHLEDSDEPVWFRLVRSRTAPGKPLDLIATRRPYDDPGVERVYYRLQRMPVTPLAKIHMPYRFDRARMDWYQKLFLEPDYTVDSLPGYEREVASNPFKAFLAIPVASRYRFLLEESRFTIMNFIKGPVCRGQVALNVIDDHFWVVFIDPERMDQELDAHFLAQEMDNMRMPTPKTGTVIDILSWRKYAKSHERYQRARSRYIRERLSQGRRASLDSIWDGDGSNDNGSLTVFRHFDTASVEKGLIGAVPKTAWIIDYPLLERIHYLLVAGFDVYGAVAHQLESRLYMDFLRMEGEFNFLLFMPKEKRKQMYEYWYRDARKGYSNHFTTLSSVAQDTTDIRFTSDDPKSEFFNMLRGRIHGASAERFDYRDEDVADEVVKVLASMEANRGAHNRFLPQVSFINLIGAEGDEFYTMIRNAAHSNIAQLFQEEKRRLPGEDSLTLVRGFIGAYPNYFFQVEERELAAFAAAIAAMDDEADYSKLRERYGVQRNAPWFWRFADKAHARARWLDPIEYGLFDLNRYAGY